jgi:hypothetical protein
VRAFSADQDLDLAPSLTPRELAAVVEQRFGVAAGSFARALERTAYGRPSARDDDALADETAGLLRALRRAIGWPRRLRGALSPRSVSAARDRAR